MLTIVNTLSMCANVNITVMLTNVNKAYMLMNVNITTMPKPTNSAAVGALVREHREAAGLTQTQLAERIGASRFWVAAFEKGKPSAELGLALKAIQAVGLTLQIEPADNAPTTEDRPFQDRAAAELATFHYTRIRNLLAHNTLPGKTRSSVAGWPSEITPVLDTAGTTTSLKHKTKNAKLSKRAVKRTTD